MRYVISYDIVDDARRERVAEMLKGYGRRIEGSVFLADLEDDLADEMERRFRAALHTEDTGRLFVLCRACGRRARAFGRGELDGDAEFYVV